MRFRSALVVAILAGIATTTPVRADSVYAYWSYWQGDSGAWKYAVTGPATAPAIDGAVDGWRFTLGTDGKAATPSSPADFEAVCGSTAKESGKVRVAIFIDYGSASDQPALTRCAVVASGLSRASALSAVATLRLKSGFICGINDIPRDGCGDAVAAPSTTSSASSAPTATATPTPTNTKPAPAASTSAPEATNAPSASPTATPTTAPKQDDSSTTSNVQQSVGVQSSPVSTVVTMILGALALAIAFRNARRQKEQR